MCDFLKGTIDVRSLITLQNVRSGQPFQMILVYSSLAAEKRLLSEVFAVPQSSDNSWFRNQVQKSDISLQTHTHISFQIDVIIHMLMQNVVFDQKFCFQVAINPLKINTNSATFRNETFPSDEQNAPFPFLAEVFLSF